MSRLLMQRAQMFKLAKLTKHRYRNLLMALDRQLGIEK
jgi:hypothetical protein